MLTPEIERVVKEKATELGTTPEQFVLDVLRQKLSGPGSSAPAAPRDEWEGKLRQAGSPAGVSLSDDDLGRENLYD